MPMECLSKENVIKDKYLHSVNEWELELETTIKNMMKMKMKIHAKA